MAVEGEDKHDWYCQVAELFEDELVRCIACKETMRVAVIAVGMLAPQVPLHHVHSQVLPACDTVPGCNDCTIVSAVAHALVRAGLLQGNRFIGIHWFYRPEDTCLLVDKDLVKKKAQALAKAEHTAWQKACREAAARRVSVKPVQILPRFCFGQDAGDKAAEGCQGGRGMLHHGHGVVHFAIHVELTYCGNPVMRFLRHVTDTAWAHRGRRGCRTTFTRRRKITRRRRYDSPLSTDDATCCGLAGEGRGCAGSGEACAAAGQGESGCEWISTSEH